MKMYKILTYKKLAIFAFSISAIMILSSVLNAFFPVVSVFSKEEKSVFIVMYHQISENSKLWGDYVIPESLLREDFKFLKESGIDVISFNDLMLYKSGKKDLPEKSVIITFDDGERSFLTKVVPLLEEFSFSANINIVGSLTDLYSENGETDDRYAYLNWNDIKNLSENPLIEIGHHSYAFHTLGNRKGMGKLYSESNSAYVKIMSDDIKKLNDKMFSEIGIKPVVFAYPYGIRNDTLFELVKNDGFLITVTCRERVNKIEKNEELYELGRFNRPFSKSSKAFFEGIGLSENF